VFAFVLLTFTVIANRPLRSAVGVGQPVSGAVCTSGFELSEPPLAQHDREHDARDDARPRRPPRSNDCA
jgi:hypothetical protein